MEMKEYYIWIDPIKHKPEEETIWAITVVENEDDFGWGIIRLLKHESGDYRSLDYSESYGIPGCGKGAFNTIFGWLPIDCPSPEKAVFDIDDKFKEHKPTQKEKIQYILSLRNKGYTYKKISKMAGLSRERCSLIVRKYKSLGKYEY